MATHYETTLPEHLNDDAMTILVQQYLDDWTYRVMASPLAKEWGKHEVHMSALEVLQMHGLKYTPEEMWQVAHFPDEQLMIMDIVSRMPDDLRDKFEQITRHLRSLVTSATALRKGIESKGDDQLEEAFAVYGSSKVGQEVMKNTVISASKEIENLRRCSGTWKKSMERRLHRLTSSAEMAEHAQQQLLAVEAQLEAFAGDANGKSKKVLQGLAAGQSKTLMHTCFTAWCGDMLGNKQDKEIRMKYENQLHEAEKRLIAHKERKIANIKQVLLSDARGKTETLLRETIRLWKGVTDENKLDGETKAKLKALEDKLAHTKKSSAENTKKVMARLTKDNEEMLYMSAWTAMKSYCESYAKNKEFEDAVKKTEANMKAHMEKKKDEAKRVLDSMHNSTSTGLMEHCFHAWSRDVEESMKRKTIENAMYDTDCRLKSFLDKQAGNAMGVQTRTIDQMNENQILKFFGAWKIETKSATLDKYYSKKLDGKRGQLQKVQSLFKKFASELEEGLGNIEGDSATASDRKSLRTKPGMMKGDGGGSVSLPDIRARPA
jgi:hypothetical protein